MDPQFEELAKEIAASVTAAVTASIEKRLRDSEERFKGHIDTLETRIEGRLAIHFEGVKDQVKRGAEGYGATLESIDRRLDRLEKDWSKNSRLHSTVLNNHADRIDAIEKRG